MGTGLVQDCAAVFDGAAAMHVRSVMEAEKALYRKIVWRIVPLAMLGYVIAYIDRINVGFAKLQFASDLGFSDAVYGVGAGLFFAGYFLLEVPSNMLMHRIGARSTFVRIMVLWGALTVGMAFVSSPMQFYVMRFLLGAAEAGFFPGIILYFSYWFPEAIRGRVTSVFAMGASVAGLVGSPISSWLMSLDGLYGLRGWQILFLYEGLPAILLGFVCLFAVTDRPEQASWLDAGEKALLATRLAFDKRAKTDTGGGGPADALKNPRVYLFALAYLSILAATQAVALWTPSLLKNLHVSTGTIGWLTSVPFLTAMICTFLLGRSSDRFGERRWHFAAAISVAGSALMLCGQLPSGVASILVSMSLVASGAWAALGVFWTMPPALLSEKSRAVGIGVISSAGAIGGFVSPTIVGWSSTSLGSLFPGFAIIGAMLLLSAIVVLLAIKPGATAR